MTNNFRESEDVMSVWQWVDVARCFIKMKWRQSPVFVSFIDVFMEGGTVWLNQASIAQLYQTTPQNITKHIKNIYVEGELDENRTCNYYSQVQIEGGRSIHLKIN